MFALTYRARIYWSVVIFAGISAAILSQVLSFPARPHSTWEILSFSTLALLFGGQKLSLNPARKGEAAVSMSLGFAITFAALIRFGPEPVVPISMLCCLSSCLYPKRQKLHQLAFNVSLSAVDALAAAVVFLALNRWTLELEPTKTFAAVCGSCATMFLTNTFGVSAMIALCTEERPLSIWKEHFSWTAPGYLASACVGALAMILFHGNSAAMFLFVLPIAYLAHQFIVAHLASLAEHKQHIADLEAKQAELEHLYVATIESLALAIDAKDQYTHQHIVRVQRYAVAIAEEMGLSGKELQGVRTGALLHDIGKLGVPEHVLLKPGKLTAEEYEQIKQHPGIGAAILDPVDFPWPVLPAVKHHHERWNGSGYPDGLAGAEIPLTARIMAVADVYDALTSTRSYRDAWPHDQAMQFIQGGAGSDFDPSVVDAFIQVIEAVVGAVAADGPTPVTDARKRAEEAPVVAATDSPPTRGLGAGAGQRAAPAL